jgi:hypothetical protein
MRSHDGYPHLRAGGTGGRNFPNIRMSQEFHETSSGSLA